METSGLEIWAGDNDSFHLTIPEITMPVLLERLKNQATPEEIDEWLKSKDGAEITGEGDFNGVKYKWRLAK